MCRTHPSLRQFDYAAHSGAKALGRVAQVKLLYALSPVPRNLQKKHVQEGQVQERQAVKEAQRVLTLRARFACWVLLRRVGIAGADMHASAGESRSLGNVFRPKARLRRLRRRRRSWGGNWSRSVSAAALSRWYWGLYAYCHAWLACLAFLVFFASLAFLGCHWTSKATASAAGT